MILLVTEEDYCILKISITASLAGIDLKIRSDVTPEELLTFDPKAKSLALQTTKGNLSQHTAILRYLGDLSAAVPLCGQSPYENSQVDQWLEFSWIELEVPIQTLIALKSTDSNSLTLGLSSEKKTSVKQRCESDISVVLTVLEDHLSTRTFFVGERISIADISFYSAFGALLAHSSSFNVSNYPSIFRWYMTVGSQPKIISNFPLPASVHGISDAAKIASVSGHTSTNNNFVGESSRSTATSDVTSIMTTGKWNRHRIRIKELLSKSKYYVNQAVTVKGWIRTIRDAEKGKTIFVELTDGSTVQGLQLVLSAETTAGCDNVINSGGVGASLAVTGKVVASPKVGQYIEIQAVDCQVLGKVFGGDNNEVGGKYYPMSKRGHSLEYLREKAHLRPRSKVISCAMRLRHAMSYATHKFFNDRGFVYTHTPIITAADCEGAGEQFVVTSLLPEHAKVSDIPVDKVSQTVDYSKDYFGRRCCLTVSGQLNVETHACALSDVYTFGPTFRAELSHTSRHLAEFWMIEPEICFADLADDMALAEDYVKYCTQYALQECEDDLAYFEEEYPNGEKGLRARLRNVLENDFARLTYTDAIELLQKHSAAGKVVFNVFPEWGDDLGSEHERYLAEKVFCRPTIVTDYPKGIKAFYMKLNEDGKTVAAMDILVPKIGELIGGSQR